MPDYSQMVEDALDILKFDGDVTDTLAELRQKWSKQIPVLQNGCFDRIATQYMRLSHEQGVAALGQELSAFGWALYDLCGDDIYLFALIPQAQQNAFETFCKKQNQYCRLLKQRGRKWGDHANAQDPGKLMHCEEYTLSGEEHFFIHSLSGDFAAGQWKNKEEEKWLKSCIVDLSCRPPRLVKLNALYHLKTLCYSAENKLYAAATASASGMVGHVLVGRDPAKMDDWFCPSPIGYDGPPQMLVWSGRALWAGDPCNATRIEITERGTCKDVKNWNLPQDGWSGSNYCGIAADGTGRIYFSNEWRDGTLYKWENGEVNRHPFKLSGYDHLSEAIPALDQKRLYMIHATSGKGRIEENLLELDMDTGQSRIVPLPGMGEGLRLRWFTGNWLLVQGNGEVLSDDFAQLINIETREVLRIRPGMFGSEKMQHIGVLTDGTVVIVIRRTGVGPVFCYPTNFWEFLRTANKPKKLERWREYKELYPDLPFTLPPKAAEKKAELKRESLTICGKVLTPPFTLEQLSSTLGTARIVIQNDVRKDDVTGEEAPYTQVFAVWDALGLQGWLEEDEATIRTLALCLAPHSQNLPQREFDGTFRIGGRSYRDAKWEPFGFAQTRKLGGFTVFTRLPSPISDEVDSKLRKRMEHLASRVEISWKAPVPKAAKLRKYRMEKPDEPVLKFDNFNFKLAVVEVLMYEKGLLIPKFDIGEFAQEYGRRKINVEEEGYAPIPEAVQWFKRLAIPARLASEVTELDMDGGSEVYGQIWPFWDGEDGYFDLNSISGEELRQFSQLRHVTLMSSREEQVAPLLEHQGIQVELL